jgi:hypothetical protein
MGKCFCVTKMGKNYSNWEMITDQFISDSEREEKSHNTVYMPFGIEYRYRIATRWDLKLAIDGLLGFG